VAADETRVAAIGDRLILRGSIEAHGWLSGGATYDVAASVTVVEVLGRSICVKVDSVSGIPRRFRDEAAELFEGWHRLNEIGLA
jgi:hypothetical protein